MRRLALVTAAVMGAAGAVVFAQTPAPSAAPLTLDAAVQLALAQNKTIAAARLQRPVDLAGVGVAGERPNPDVTYENSRDTPRDSLSLSLPIELGGKRGARIRVAEATVATGEAQLDQTIAGIRDDVRRTYLELAAAERRGAIAREVAGLFAQARDAAHTRFTLGEGPEREDVAAQVDYLVAQNDVTAADGEAAATRAELNVLLGQPPDAPIALADTLDLRAVPTAEATLARATQINVDLRVLDRRIAEQTARVSLASAQRVPDLTAGAGVTFDAQPDFSVGWRVDFGLTVPLFTTHKSGVILENAELARLRAEREATVAEIGGAIAAALARARAAEAQVTAYQRDILPMAQRDEAFAQTAYRAGSTGLADLILSLQHARERRQAAVDAALAFHLALADLERAVAGPLK